MIELIPTLLAQKPLKQVALPVQPIEPSSLTQSQTATPTVTPDSAIAIPESVFVPVKATPIPSPTATPAAQKPPVASRVTLPKVPQVRTSRSTAQPTPQSVNSATIPQNQSVDPKSGAATPTKLTAQPTLSPTLSSTTIEKNSTEQAKPRTSGSIEIPVPKPMNQVAPEVSRSRVSSSIESPAPKSTHAEPEASRSRASGSIEIPVPKPINAEPEVSRSGMSDSVEGSVPKPINPVKPEASEPRASDRIESPARPTAQTSPESPTEAQKQLLEQRLSDIVSQDRAVKQAAQRDTLIARAYSFATQRRFEQARKLLQDPAILADVRDQVLSNINSLEASSRAIGVTPIKAPPIKQNNRVAARKAPARVSRSIAIRVPRPQQTISIQVPRAIDSLPIQQKPPTTDLADPIASDASTNYSGQVVNPGNLQAFNRNLPKLNSASQIVYPLPEPVPVTSRFGWRRHPVTGVRRFHAGVDLGAGQGTPVIASRGGKVKVADRLGGYGLAIVLQQSNGAQDTLYAHLSQIFVRPGETIQPGTIIGRVGSTGLSTGPHLHYEARRKTNSGWVAVDPGGQLEAARVRLVQARRIEAQSSSNRGG